ncbi:unnamed protein product [Cyclocybe aegerita]|uniref:Protein kinase domain-containing protein n=1 Tax=Cyclocybe aegerita TaxID=1973307 RepID=A0A8S0VSJ4_CYCAE|nr:unnamed protein product [Cyclocybe aegerita]
MSYPEEPLDLPPTEGGGYYPANIRQKLNGDKYEIVRKLGYGPRSSTWLVWDSRDADYFAVKIFTITASEQAKTVELPILRVLDSVDASLRLPAFHGSFWEKSGDGDHLCVVTNPLSTSIHVLQEQAEHQRLPVHVVQRIVRTVADALEGLHGAGIMHGAVKADNILFSTATQPEFLKPILDSEPAPTTSRIKKHVAVRSQPLIHDFKWNDKPKRVVDWPLILNNFGHAQSSTYKPEKNGDYSFAPETLLQQASCSPQTDIWMLGIMTFTLLTGGPPFYLTGNISKQIATLSAALEDELPKEWLGDSKMKDFNTTAHGYAPSLESGLEDALHKDDVAAATAFVKGCLRLDPKKRFTSTECSDHEWLAAANACSCGFC